MMITISMEEWRQYNELMMLAVNMELLRHDLEAALESTAMEMLGDTSLSDLHKLREILEGAHSTMLDELSERIIPNASEGPL